MKQKYLKDVVSLKLDKEKCKGCGLCTLVCPHQLFILEGGKAEIIDKDSCMECGACAKNCPFAALEVKAGVGCAYAIIVGKLRDTEADCSCGNDDSDCC